MPRGVRGLVVLMAPHYRRGSQIKEAARLSRPDGAILWVHRRGLTTPHPSARSSGKGSFQRRTATNTRKEPAMATIPESFVDALNSAFGKQTTQRSSTPRASSYSASSFRARRRRA